MLQEQGTLAKWESSAWAKKLSNKKIKAGLTDFDRFKRMVCKKQKAKLIADKVAELSA